MTDWEKSPYITAKQIRYMILTVIISALGYGFTTFWGGWEQVLTAVKDVGVTRMFAILGLSLMSLFLRFVRWQLFLFKLGNTVPWWKSLHIYLVGFSLTITPGRAGEAIRSVYLKDFDVPYRNSFSLFLAERFYDFMAVLLIAGLSLGSHGDKLTLLISLALFLGGLIWLLHHRKLMMFIEEYSARKFHKRLSYTVTFILEMLYSLRECFSFKVMTVAQVLGFVSWGMQGWAFYLILSNLQAPVSFESAQFIYAFSLAIGAITLLPGGLGGTEAVMIKLLLVQGLPFALAVAAVLVIRLATLWFSVVLGSILFLFLPKERVPSANP